MTFKVMDVLDMQEIQTGSFNVIFDKATLDSILCGDNSGANAEKMINEIYRILAPGGRYICITYGDPEHRKKYLETQQWSDLSVEKIPKPNSTMNSEENNNSKNFHYGGSASVYDDVIPGGNCGTVRFRVAESVVDVNPGAVLVLC